MKKLMKGLLALIAAITLSTGVVDAATATKKIDTTKCETVYTNYYFFLDANTASYFNNGPLTTYRHSNIAQYTNNSYQISNFDPNNIGYGQMIVNPSSVTSGDKLTSLSLYDFYSTVKYASSRNGAYSTGTNNLIFSHNWYAKDNAGNSSYHTDNLSIQNATIQQLMNATVNAESTISNLTGVSPYRVNPMEIQIDRSYYGYLTGTPVTLDNNQWYFHPAVYYVQYCSPKQQPAPVEYYHVYYKPGTNDTVVNMPSDSTHNVNNDMYIDQKIPSRTGYTFLGWTTDSASPVNNPSFNPGAKYTDRKDLVLYAVWKKNEEKPVTPPDNPQTGIEDYMIPFGGAIGISGAALTVLKKKKGFKQF